MKKEEIKVVKTNKMAACLSLQEEEMLAEKVKPYPALYDKRVKGYKEKDVVRNAWTKVAEKPDLVENGNTFLNLHI